MSGRLLPGFLQVPLKKQIRIEAWKTAPVAARSFASSGDGPVRKYGIASKPEASPKDEKKLPSAPTPPADTGKLPASPPSTSPPPPPPKNTVKENATVAAEAAIPKTTPSGAPPRTPGSSPGQVNPPGSQPTPGTPTAKPPGTPTKPPSGSSSQAPPGTPAKPPSGNGLVYGFALLGLAGAGGFVWYTWNDGGPWGLWGPDLYPGKQPPPAPKKEGDLSMASPKGLETDKVQREGVEKRGGKAGGRPQEGGAEGTGQGGRGGAESSGEVKRKRAEAQVEAGAALAAVGAEVAASAAEESAESAEDVEDSFDSFAQAVEAARKANLAAEVAASKVHAPQDTPLPESGNENNEANTYEEAESDGGERTVDGEVILKDPASLPKLLAAVTHEARTAQQKEDLAHFDNQIKEAHARAIREADLRNKLEKILRNEREGHAKALQRQGLEAEEKRKQDLKAQAEELKLAAEVAMEARLVKERVKTVEELEGISQKLAGLELAFDARSKDARKSYYTHKLALAAFALETEVRNGTPLRASAAALQQLLAEDGASDPLLEVALAALPSDAIDNGIATRTQLQQQFMNLKAQAKELSMVPANKGGLISHALAKIIAMLKISESGNNLPGGGSDAAIARAEALLADGDLPGVAAVLREGLAGSEAEVAASGWTRDAQQTAEVEQFLSLIQAHAATQAASLR